MDQLHIPYSLKAIAHPPRALYQKLLVKSVSDFMTNLRWKVISILRPFQSNTKKTFGFKTSNSPPFVPELKSFEEELLSLVSHVKYRPVSNDFQRQLKDDRDKILRSKEVIVLADKSQNIYKMPPEVYKKKMVECISTTYKKSGASQQHQDKKNQRKHVMTTPNKQNWPKLNKKRQKSS